MNRLDQYEQLVERVLDSEAALRIECAIELGSARPPNRSGVYALFFEGKLKYVGQASGNRGLLNRRNNYVSGDDGHTTHRAFLNDFPDKPTRRLHIEQNVLMAWKEISSPALTKAIERILIWRLEPEWNRD